MSYAVVNIGILCEICLKFHQIKWVKHLLSDLINTNDKQSLNKNSKRIIYFYVKLNRTEAHFVLNVSLYFANFNKKKIISVS